MTKKDIEKLSKEELVGIVEKLLDNELTKPSVEYCIERYFRSKHQNKLKRLEAETLEVKHELESFEQEMVEKYKTDNFKVAFIKLNFEEKWKWLNLINKHTDCLDAESKELDRECERIESKWK